MSSERERNGGSHRAADRADAPFDPDPKIFAGGLPFSLSPEEVRDLFEQHGTIVEFHVSRLLCIPAGHVLLD
jgi:RNA recognition motif-containing protein